MGKKYSTEKFDLDEIIADLQQDDTWIEEEIEYENSKRCPCCGSQDWSFLETNKFGKITGCSGCKHDRQ